MSTPYKPFVIDARIAEELNNCLKLGDVATFNCNLSVMLVYTTPQNEFIKHAHYQCVLAYMVNMSHFLSKGFDLLTEELLAMFCDNAAVNYDELCLKKMTLSEYIEEQLRVTKASLEPVPSTQQPVINEQGKSYHLPVFTETFLTCLETFEKYRYVEGFTLSINCNPTSKKLLVYGHLTDAYGRVKRSANKVWAPMSQVLMSIQSEAYLQKAFGTNSHTLSQFNGQSIPDALYDYFCKFYQFHIDPMPYTTPTPLPEFKPVLPVFTDWAKAYIAEAMIHSPSMVLSMGSGGFELTCQTATGQRVLFFKDSMMFEPRTTDLLRCSNIRKSPITVHAPYGDDLLERLEQMIASCWTGIHEEEKSKDAVSDNVQQELTRLKACYAELREDYVKLSEDKKLSEVKRAAMIEAYEKEARSHEQTKTNLVKAHKTIEDNDLRHRAALELAESRYRIHHRKLVNMVEAFKP